MRCSEEFGVDIVWCCTGVGFVIGGCAGSKLGDGITCVGAPMSWIGGPAGEGDGEVGTLAGADVPPEEAFFSNRVSNSTTRCSMTVEVSSRAGRWSTGDGGSTEVVGEEAIQAHTRGNIMENSTKPQAPRQRAAVRVWS